MFIWVGPHCVLFQNLFGCYCTLYLLKVLRIRLLRFRHLDGILIVNVLTYRLIWGELTSLCYYVPTSETMGSLCQSQSFFTSWSKRVFIFFILFLDICWPADLWALYNFCNCKCNLSALHIPVAYCHLGRRVIFLCQSWVWLPYGTPIAPSNSSFNSLSR